MRDSEKNLELVKAFQYVDAKYMGIADQERVTRKRRHVRMHWGVAAASVALVLMLAAPAAAIASNWLGLRDLLIPVSPEPSEALSPVADSMPTLPMRDFIGLSGYAESAEAQALREWQLFLGEYDKDGAILKQVGNDLTGLEEKYSAYMVYTQEMADKLEEITQKYDLKLHTEYMDSWNSAEAREMMTKAFAGEGHTFKGGYAYADGTFQFTGCFQTKDGRVIDYQLRRCAKGVFDEVLLSIGNVEDYQEKSYRTAQGDEVTLAYRPDVKSLIFADSEDYFISVNLLLWQVDSITEEELKQFADSIDFAALQKAAMPYD